MSEISARASRRAFREGSWERNGLVGRPVDGAGAREAPADAGAAAGAAGLGAAGGIAAGLSPAGAGGLGGVDGPGGVAEVAGAAGVAGTAGADGAFPGGAAAGRTPGMDGPAAGATGRGGAAGRGGGAVGGMGPGTAALGGWELSVGCAFDGASLTTGRLGSTIGDGAACAATGAAGAGPLCSPSLRTANTALQTLHLARTPPAGTFAGSTR